MTLFQNLKFQNASHDAFTFDDHLTNQGLYILWIVACMKGTCNAFLALRLSFIKCLLIGS